MQEVKGDIVALYFYDRLLTDLKALQGTGRQNPKIIINSAAEELFPILPRILPPGSETLNFVDYTPARILKRREILRKIPARELPTSLIYTLHDDNVGLVPMLSTGSLHEITGDIRRYGWSGFSTRYWLIGDHDPCVAYLARAAWHADATPESVYRDLLGVSAARGPWWTCSKCFAKWKQRLWPRVARSRLHVSRARHDHETLAAGTAGRGTCRRSRALRPRPGGGSPCARGLSQPRQALRRLLDRPSGIRRGLFRCRAVLSPGRQGEPRRQKDQAIEDARTALDQARAALDAYARIAQDQSDRGAIATMSEYVYRPLRARSRSCRSSERSPLMATISNLRNHTRITRSILPVMVFLLMACSCMVQPAWSDWQTHQIRQGDGKGAGLCVLHSGSC